MESAFEVWCDKPWSVRSNWDVVPCVVHVSPTCEGQWWTAFSEGGGPDPVRIAASYHDDLAAKYHTGQVRHALAEPLEGEWHVLWHLGMLYIDTEPHPIPTRERLALSELA